jgi:putative sterol carrier protein
MINDPETIETDPETPIQSNDDVSADNQHQALPDFPENKPIRQEATRNVGAIRKIVSSKSTRTSSNTVRDQRGQTSATDSIEWVVNKIKDRGARRAERVQGLNLVGTVEFVIGADASDTVTLIWKGDEVTCFVGTAPSKADCRITLSKGIFEELKAGSLNAQIAMCAGKIKVQGTSETFAELAMYTFNVFS